MTKFLRLTLLTLCLLPLTGCGSFLASVQSEPIEADPGKRTYGARIEDESIETKARVNISAASEELKRGHINVTSYNGYVLVAGQVPEPAAKQLATDIVRKIRGVRHIYNELEVIGNSSTMTRSSDTWLTTKVKSALLTNAEIEGNRVKVMTENGVVYLLGLASRTEAKRITEVARATAGVQKVVELFELID